MGLISRVAGWLSPPKVGQTKVDQSRRRFLQAGLRAGVAGLGYVALRSLTGCGDPEIVRPGNKIIQIFKPSVENDIFGTKNREDGIIRFQMNLSKTVVSEKSNLFLIIALNEPLTEFKEKLFFKGLVSSLIKVNGQDQAIEQIVYSNILRSGEEQLVPVKEHIFMPAFSFTYNGAEIAFSEGIKTVYFFIRKDGKAFRAIEANDKIFVAIDGDNNVLKDGENFPVLGIAEFTSVIDHYPRMYVLQKDGTLGTPKPIEWFLNKKSRDSLSYVTSEDNAPVILNQITLNDYSGKIKVSDKTEQPISVEKKGIVITKENPAKVKLGTIQHINGDVLVESKLKLFANLSQAQSALTLAERRKLACLGGQITIEIVFG